MKTWKMLTVVISLMLASLAFVFFVGIQPKAISKIGISQFENSDVVVNSLFVSIEPDLISPAIFFLGIDTSDANDPMMKEILSKFWSKMQQTPHPFQAMVVDQSIQIPEGMQAEHFDFRKEPERFIEGLKSAEKQAIHLLVVVPVVEASPKIPDSLMSLARKTIYTENPAKVAGLVFTSFPRQRQQEEFVTVPCNTGEEDQGQTATLGCYVIQKARFLYRKKYPSGMHVGLLDQLGQEEFVFLLTREP